MPDELRRAAEMRIRSQPGHAGSDPTPSFSRFGGRKRLGRNESAPDKAVIKADRRGRRGRGVGRDVRGMRMDLLLRDGGISSAS